jgi:hypothetical protein
MAIVMSSTTAKRIPSGVPAFAWRAIWIELALAGGFAPLSMAMGIIVWGGWDVTIGVLLLLCVFELVGLLVALIAVSSEKKLFAWVGGLSSLAIACVTLLFLIEFVFFRASNTSLFEKVPVFRTSIPLIVLYAFSLIFSSIEMLVSALRIQRLNIPR